MKIALIFPPNVTWEVMDPPLGLAWIAASLERAGHKVKILDASILKMTYLDVLKWIRQFDPGAIGITTLTPHFWQVKTLSNMIKQELPNIPLIYGGAHTSILPKQTLRETPADIAVIGEGDTTVVELVDAIEKKKGFNGIKGLMYKDGAKIIFTGARVQIENLDSLPLPARHLLPLYKYGRKNIFVRQLPFTTAIASRGCPYNCYFCSSCHVWGRRLRYRSVNNVIEEIHELVDTYRIREIFFHDDCLTINKRWAIDFCEKILQEKLDITWQCMVRVDQVNDELFKLMRRSGCHTIWFGVESGNQKILNNIRKNIQLTQVEDALKLAKHYSFENIFFLMIGNYGENYNTMMDTLLFAKKLSPDHIAISIAYPYPGTDFFDLAHKEQLIVKESWNGLRVGADSIIRTDDLSSRELEKLKNAMETLFYGDWAYLRQNVISPLRMGYRHRLIYLYYDFRRTIFKLQKFLINLWKLRSARIVVKELGQISKTRTKYGHLHTPKIQRKEKKSFN
ncbi:MAG: B12-binding domain-containing radical SAM protein [Candidatus Bathyarchaeota archaeon]|nr:B12-binding domain-containing radical SAM protein [Candidatus Bathyarchaeota archaeon]